MKKRTLALLLALLSLVTLLSPAAAAADSFEMQDIPIITIPGTSNCHLYNDQNERVIPDDFDVKRDILSDKALMRELLGSFAKATVTNRWDDYCDKMYDTLAPIWAQQRFDANGDPVTPLHAQNGWTPENLRKKTQGFSEGDYYYRYDWRLDPFLIADDLHAYIRAVLRVTGKPKVGLLGRCYGACVLAAYLQKYGGEGLVDTSVFYCPTVKGIETVDAIFSGAFALSGDDLTTYLRWYLDAERPIDDENLTAWLRDFAVVLNACGALDLTGKTLLRFIEKFKSNLLPRLLRVSYGSYPGYWAMVSEERLADALRFTFGGVESQYAGLIDKINTYHRTVQTPLFDLLDGLQSDGMRLIVIAKYGQPAYPYFKGCNYQTDGSNSIFRMSFGGTAAPITETLSDAYVQTASQAGTAKYISADRKIDASTCRYPDQTWFFKDVAHTKHPPFLMGLVTYAVQRTDQLTVWNDPGTVQFMRPDESGAFVPVPADDPSDEKWEQPSALRAFLLSLRSLFRLIGAKLSDLFRNH